MNLHSLSESVSELLEYGRIRVCLDFEPTLLKFMSSHYYKYTGYAFNESCWGNDLVKSYLIYVENETTFTFQVSRLYK